jgi:transposase
MAESGKRRRFFPDAFKLEAVAAVRGGRPASQVAAELGLPDRLVRVRRFHHSIPSLTLR